MIQSCLNISDEALTNLSKLILSFKSIQYLNLKFGENPLEKKGKITDTGFFNFSQRLRYLSSLKSLSLDFRK